MRQVVSAVDAVEGCTGGVDQLRKTRLQFGLCIEPFDHSQAEQCLVNGRKDLRVLFLSFGRSTLEAAPDAPDEEDRDRHEQQHKERQLPRDDKAGDEVHEDHDRVLEQDIQGGHDGGLDLVHIVRHAGHDISPPRLGEVTHGQGQDLIVQLLTQVSQHAGTNRHHEVVRQPRRAALETGHDDEEQTE